MGVRPQDLCDFSSFDALVLSGGTDINPSYYGQQAFVSTQYDDQRDRRELWLIKQAELLNKPILAICRGMELINIYYNGTLHQELSQIFDDFLPTSSTLGKIIARHLIIIKEGSLINEILKTTACKVNSLHHQGIDRLGDGLVATARLKNGIIQAVEKNEKPWILGVQWHPEYLMQISLFKCFIDNAYALKKKR